jgi:hypothetical protein
MRKTAGFILALAGLGLVGVSLFTPRMASAADVYCDHERRTCSDLPFAGAERVHIQTTGQSTGESTSPAQTTTTARTTPSNDTAAKQAVAKDIADARADQCKKATEAYQQTIAARRIYKEGKDGERNYLSDEEADKMRVDSHAAMDAACGTQAAP